MIGTHLELAAVQIWTPPLHAEQYCKQLPIRSIVVALSTVQLPAEESHRAFSSPITSGLQQDSTDTNHGSITLNDERVLKIWQGQIGSRHYGTLHSLKEDCYSGPHTNALEELNRSESGATKVAYLRI